VSKEDKKPGMRIVQGASEVIRALMEDQGIHKAELARRVGKSRAYVTQSLSGHRNMTLSTLASYADALNADAVIDLKPREERAGRLTPKQPAAPAPAPAPTPRKKKRGKQK
jgi:transcriptional regulator with XRE-family HTH domain